MSGPSEYPQQGLSDGSGYNSAVAHITHQPSHGFPPPPGAPTTQHFNPNYQQVPHPRPIVQQPGLFNMTTINNAMYIENPPPIPMQTLPGGGDPSIGLQYLRSVSALHVRQHIEVLEIMTGINFENKYTIYNETGQPVFNAIESAPYWNMVCCGDDRQFTMKVYDVYNNEVISFARPLACSCSIIPCGLGSMEVYAPPGTMVGRVEQQWSCWPSFSVKNSNEISEMRIQGPYCTVPCGTDRTFTIIDDQKGTEIGEIVKEWSGMALEMVSNADNFKITFPADLNVGMKATLLGALFFIDYTYYENKQAQSGHHHRHH